MRWFISKLDAIDEWLANDVTLWGLVVLSAGGLAATYILLLKW